MGTKNTLHLRMNNHQSDYNRRFPDKPVAILFNSVDHRFSDFSIMVIEKRWQDGAVHWQEKESYWIHTLKSLTLHGLNLEL